MDHVWEEPLSVDAVIGFESNPHHLHVWAPDAEAAAFTGQITALSLDNGCGVKFKLGPMWVERMRQRAREIEQQARDL